MLIIPEISDRITSSLTIISAISVPLLYRQNYLAADQVDIVGEILVFLLYRQNYLAADHVDHRRDFSASIKQKGITFSLIILIIARFSSPYYTGRITSPMIIGNFRKFSENVRERSSCLRNNFEISSEIFGRWSEIFGKSSKTPSSACLYNKKNITRRLEDMNFIFSWQKNNILRTRCARS